MKDKVMIMLLFFLTFFFIVPSSAQSGQIDIYITSVSVHKGEEIGVFIIESDVSIINNNADNVKFTYSDLCEFKINVTSSPIGTENYYPYPCLEATKMVEFEPGITNTTATGGIKLENTNDTMPPDGNYSITILLHELQMDAIHQVFGGQFLLQNGVIIWSDLITEPVFQLLDRNYGSLNFPYLSFLVLPILYVVQRKRLQ